MKYFDWKIGGLLLGLTFFIAILFVKPIGVSTTFSVISGIVQDTVDANTVYETTENASGYGSKYEYFNQNDGKLAEAIANPLHYSLIFVVSIIIGGLLAILTNKKVRPSKEEKVMPQIFRERISSNPWVRYAVVFVSGALSLFAARFAGGCTSGHMMSGMMQMSVSGFAFAAAVFISAIPTAMLVYRKR